MVAAAAVRPIFIGIAALTALLMAPMRLAFGAVTAASTDGEARVYLVGDFTKDFRIASDVRFPPQTTNRSWSFVGILLIGREPGSAAVSVGLSRGNPSQRLSAFTTAASPGLSNPFRAVPAACAVSCRIELRSRSENIFALVNGRTIGSWPRSTFWMRSPYIQVNGEVSELGDRIDAEVRPIYLLAGARKLKAPACSFTTQGIEAHRRFPESLEFCGVRRRDAPVTYVSLRSGAHADTCRNF